MKKKGTNLKRVETPTDKASARRERFTTPEQSGQKSKPPVLLIVVPLLLVLVAGAFVLGAQQQNPANAAQPAVAGEPNGLGYVGGLNSSAPNKRYPVVTADSEGDFRFPVSAFADGKARFFSTTLPNGKTVNFFVLKSSDGVIRAAFDACDVCYSARKGYYQDGDYMVCNNCGQRFPSAKVNDVRGGCNPSPLTRTIQGDSVVIKLSDMQKENKAENGQPLF